MLQTPDPVVVQAPDFPTPPPWVTLPPAVFVIIALAVVAGGVFILWPLMRALGRRLEGKGREDPALHEELEHLRARLAEVDGVQQDRKSTRLNSSHIQKSRMPSSA